jgi:ribosome-associated protein
MEEPVSKSQKKRDADSLQKMGVAFINLSLTKLDSLPLTDNLRKAIIDAKSIKSHGAKRRQAQLIGKLMRAADHEAILAAYEQIIEEDSAVTANFHEVELWRDKLIEDGKDALTEFIDIYQPEDVQQLRQLIKKAVDDRLKEKNSGAAKALFRYLRSTIK